VLAAVAPDQCFEHHGIAIDDAMAFRLGPHGNSSSPVTIASTRGRRMTPRATPR